MFLTIEYFVTDLLINSPTVAVFEWEEHPALTSFVERLSPALKEQEPAISLLALFGF